MKNYEISKILSFKLEFISDITDRFNYHTHKNIYLDSLELIELLLDDLNSELQLDLK